jgi:glucokinase
MRAAIVASDGQILLRVSEPTPHEATCPDAFELLMDSVRDRGGGRGSFEAIIVGLPGRVNYRAGELEYAPNLPPSWWRELSEANLKSHFDAEVFLANDADLAAVGETYFGAGKNFADVVYITISTGIGAGVVLGGRVLRGMRSMVEIGHTIIVLDRLISGEPATAEALSAGPALARYAAAENVAARGADLVAQVRAGDPRARAAWDRAMLAAGATVVNLAHLFSPEVIVIGGGVGRNGKLVLDPLSQMMAEHGPPAFEPPIALVEAILGDDSGLMGGAAWPIAIGVRQ